MNLRQILSATFLTASVLAIAPATALADRQNELLPGAGPVGANSILGSELSYQSKSSVRLSLTGSLTIKRATRVTARISGCRRLALCRDRSWVKRWSGRAPDAELRWDTVLRARGLRSVAIELRAGRFRLARQVHLVGRPGDDRGCLVGKRFGLITSGMHKLLDSRSMKMSSSQLVSSGSLTLTIRPLSGRYVRLRAVADYQATGSAQSRLVAQGCDQPGGSLCQSADRQWWFMTHPGRNRISWTVDLCGPRPFFSAGVGFFDGVSNASLARWNFSLR